MKMLRFVFFALACACGAAPAAIESTGVGPAPLVRRALSATGDCSSRAALGQWENVTPAVLEDDAGLVAGGCGYGVRSFVVDPNNAATIMLGTCGQGVFKSSDCGFTWVHIDTGTNGAALDSGRQWALLVDPTSAATDDAGVTSSQVYYAPAGYGSPHSYLYKTSNAGVDWAQSWPPTDGSWAGIVTNNFAGSPVMDPSNSAHLLLTFHAGCLSPHANACFGESLDSGVTWSVVEGDSRWTGSLGGQYLWCVGTTSVPMGDCNHLLYANQGTYAGNTGNYWYSSTGLAGPWTEVVGLEKQEGHEGGQMTFAGGYWYMAVDKGVARSPDGQTWSVIANSGSVGSGVTTDGTTLWWTKGFSGTYPLAYYLKSAPVDGGAPWATDTSLQTVNGGWLAFDPVYGEEYASMRQAGFFRIRRD